MLDNRMAQLIGGLVLLAVLAGGAFLAGRMLNQPAAFSPDGNAVLFNGEGGPLPGNGDFAGGVSVQVQITPAAELPVMQPEAMGVFVERNDNSFTLAMVEMALTVMGGGDSVQSMEVGGPSTDGPKVEVVVTQDTQIYRDATALDPGNPNTVVQQKVAAGSLDEMNSQTMISVWGKKTGDRIVAEIVFYSNPVMITRPGP